MTLYNYTVTLTDNEQKGMEYITTDVDFWIQNAVHERARLACEELAADTIKATLEGGGIISGTMADIVLASTLPDAKTRNAEAIRQAEQMMAQTMAAQSG